MYRIVQCKFWKDAEVFKWEVEHKLLFLYLLTSDKTNQLGVLETTIEQISYETGISIQKIEKILKELEQAGKIVLDKDEIFVRNFGKYNWTKSPKMIKHLKKLISNVKSKKIKYFVISELKRLLDIDLNIDVEYEEFEKEYPPETTAEEANQTQEQKNETSSTPYKEIVDLYHQICVSLPRVAKLSEKRKQLLRARWKEYPDLQFWQELFQRVETSDFLTGRKTDFRADFEWIIKPSNIIKIIEGRYDNAKNQNSSNDDEIISRIRNKLL